MVITRMNWQWDRKFQCALKGVIWEGRRHHERLHFVLYKYIYIDIIPQDHFVGIMQLPEHWSLQTQVLWVRPFSQVKLQWTRGLHLPKETWSVRRSLKSTVERRLIKLAWKIQDCYKYQTFSFEKAAILDIQPLWRAWRCAANVSFHFLRDTGMLHMFQQRLPKRTSCFAPKDCLNSKDRTESHLVSRAELYWSFWLQIWMI